MSFNADSSYQDNLISQYGDLLLQFLLNNVTQLSASEHEHLTGLLLAVTNLSDEGNIAPVALLIVVSVLF